MVKKTIVALGILLSVFGLHGCGGGGGGGGGGSSEVKALSEMNGYWNATETTDGLQDIYYVYIQDGGAVIIDYWGDEYDDFDQCYDISALGYFSIESDGNLSATYINGAATRYTIFEKVTVSSSGKTLTFKYTDKYDEDGDGNVTETLEEKWTKESGAQASDFNPVCT